MNWTDATLNAIKRYTEKHNTLLIPRSELIAEEIEYYQGHIHNREDARVEPQLLSPEVKRRRSDFIS